jgi:hypothetical protein
MEQFQDFERYVKGVDPYGMQSGIVLIDPPEEWKQQRKALDNLIKTIKIKNPLTQEFHGAQGIYTQRNMEKQRSYNLPQWKAICESTENQPPAKRGEKRLNADKLLGRGMPKNKKEGTPLAERAKRTAGRPRGKVVKEEPVDIDSSLVAPPTPTSPEIEAIAPAPSVEGSDGEESVASTPAKGRPRKGKPGRKAAPAAAKPRQSRAKKDTTQGTDTSVASRRLHNTASNDQDIDEEAFEGFDYRVYDNDQWTAERCNELEDKYWKSLNFSNPMYAADMPGSLFDEDTKAWNVAKLPNLLDLLGQPIPGVNTAYLYLGMWRATFAWHLEDVDLYSINYIHFGAPKQWYSVSQKDAPKFENAMKSIWGQDAKACNQFLRHKTYLVSPALLKSKYGVTVNKIVHREGQFVITFPIGYHSGYNLGYNCAESVNFAIPNWLNYGKTAKKCECEADSVFIDVDWFIRRMNGEPTPEYEEIEVTDDEDDGDDPMDLPTPPGSDRGKVKTNKRKRLLKDAGKKAKKKIMIRKISKFQPCCLCPNDFAWEDLLPTTAGVKAHRRCAMYTPETYIASQDGKEKVFGVENISKDRLELRCSECKQRKGACFQCSSAKCTRAYHATCAWHAGVQVDVGEIAVWHEGVEYRDLGLDCRCKLHRTVKKGRPTSDSAYLNHGRAQLQGKEFKDYLAGLKEDSLVQWQVTHSDEIDAGIVVEGHNKDRDTVLVKILPDQYVARLEFEMCMLTETRKLFREIFSSSLLFVDSSTSCLQRPSATALDLPEELQGKAASMPDSSDRKPAKGDPFTEGSETTWEEFESAAVPRNKAQKPVNFGKEKQLWHYLGELSTEIKPSWSADPEQRKNDLAANFLATVAPPRAMAPPPQPRRQSLAAAYPTYSVGNGNANALARNAAMAAQRQQMLERHYRLTQGLPISPSGATFDRPAPSYQTWKQPAPLPQYRPLQIRENVPMTNAQNTPAHYQQILARQQIKAEQLDNHQSPYQPPSPSIGIDQQAVERQRQFQLQATQQSRGMSNEWSAGRTLPPLMKYGTLPDYSHINPSQPGYASRPQAATYTNDWMHPGNELRRTSFGSHSPSPMMPQMSDSPHPQSPTLHNGSQDYPQWPQPQQYNGSYTHNGQMSSNPESMSGSLQTHADQIRPGSSGVLAPQTPPMTAEIERHRRISNPAYPFKSPEKLKAQKEAEKISPGSAFPIVSPRVKTEHSYSRPGTSASMVDPDNPPQFIDPNETQITPPQTSHGRSRVSSMSQYPVWPQAHALAQPYHFVQQQPQAEPPNDFSEFINVNNPPTQPNPLRIVPMSASLANSLQPRPWLANGLPANDRPVPTAWALWQQEGGFWGGVAEYFAERHEGGVGVYLSPYQSVPSGGLAEGFYEGLDGEGRESIDRQR